MSDSTVYTLTILLNTPALVMNWLIVTGRRPEIASDKKWTIPFVGFNALGLAFFFAAAWRLLGG